MSDTLALLSEIGPTLQRLRRERGLSVVAACRAAGRSRDTLYRLEHGEDASISTLLAFLGVLGCRLEIVPGGPPTLEEVRRRFADDDDE